jgi:hypothetical protein
MGGKAVGAARDVVGDAFALADPVRTGSFCVVRSPPGHGSAI